MKQLETIKPFEVLAITKEPEGIRVTYKVSWRSVEGRVTHTKTLTGCMIAKGDDIDAELYAYLKQSGWVE